MRRVGCFIAMVWCLAAQADDRVRTWTDVQGRAMEAQFVREIDGDATFLKDGKLVTIPLDRLTEKDQKLIRELEAGKKVQQDEPPAGALTRDNGAATDDGAATKTGNDKSRPSLANEKVVAENREWRDRNGKKTTGKFVRLHQGNVVLTRLGRVVSVRFDSLSREDQQYVRDFLAARGEDAGLPEITADNSAPPQPEAFAAVPAPEPFAPPPAAAPPAAVAPRAGFGGGDARPNRAAEMAEQARQRSVEFAQQQAQKNAERREQAAEKVAEISRQTNEGMKRAIQGQVDAMHNELVAECENCKTTLTRDQSQLTQCPHCGIYWAYEVDQLGNKHEIPGGAARAEVQAQTDPKFAAQRRPGFYTNMLTIILSSIVLIGCTARLLIYLSR